MRDSVSRFLKVFKTRNSKTLSFVAMSLIAVIGVYLVISTHAATPAIALEPENGTLTNGATAVADTTASAGKSLKFTTTPTPPPTPPQSGNPMPVGVPGNWTLKFADEFNGTSLDTTKWSNMDGGKMNNVTTYAKNISVSGGSAILTLAASGSGAEICTCKSGQYVLPVGGYAEARVYFPGNGSKLYNWPAWWVSGPNWPSAGEHDIAEVLGGSLTVNYHSSSGSHNQGAVSGYWGDAYHVYGVWRQSGKASVYWDGKLIKSYSTDDNGAGEQIIANVGGSGTYGAASQVKIDYVRAWQ